VELTVVPQPWLKDSYAPFRSHSRSPRRQSRCRTGSDRSKPPVQIAADIKLPNIQKQQLSNGLPVWIVEQHEVPVAQVNLVVLSGSADDPPGKCGIASLAASMLMEGASSRSSLELADAVDFLGAG
jgi:zinc protease